jgi:hypothetical protein
MDAMEMFNGGCLNAGYDDYNPGVYDDLLRQGKRIYCIGTDDNHGSKQEERRYWDFFRAFTMIKAEKLDYKAITDSLTKGNFYASQGPEIYDLWFEDGIIHIDCSDVKLIRFNTGVRHAKKFENYDGTPLNSAEFKLGENDMYVRVTITDSNGKSAYTNAYFKEDLLS